MFKLIGLNKNPKDLGPTESALIALCVLAFLYVGPFIFYRIHMEQWGHALVNTFVFVIAIYCMIYILQGRDTKKLHLFISLSLLISSLTVLLLGGISSIYWSYPAITISYFLLNYTLAFKLSLMLTAIVSVIVVRISDPISYLPIIVSLALTCLSNYFIFKSYRKIEDLLEQKASVDHLTNAGNRLAFDKEVCKSIDLQQRLLQPATLIIFDLDDFKKVNDKFGHAIGDKVLILTVEKVSSVIRSIDSIFRYGGEEFAVLLNNTDQYSAMAVADKIRKVVKESDFSINHQVTISLGVAEYNSPESSDSWIDRVDALLYESKKTGKDKATSASLNINQSVNQT